MFSKEADRPADKPAEEDKLVGVGKLVVAEEDKLAVAEEDMPAVAEEDMPVVAGEGKLAVAEEGKQALAEEDMPAVAEEDMPAVTEEACKMEEPMVVEELLVSPRESGRLLVSVGFRLLGWAPSHLNRPRPCFLHRTLIS